MVKFRLLKETGDSLPVCQLLNIFLVEFQEYFLGRGGMQKVHRANKLTTITCQLSCNLGASATWNLQSLSRPDWDCFTFSCHLPSQSDGLMFVIK